jgi:hypothetical protein
VTEYRTKTGRVLTDADIERLAEEAEQGYDVKQEIERLERERARGWLGLAQGATTPERAQEYIAKALAALGGQ